MPMTVLIQVEYEGPTSKHDLGIRERFPLEQVRDAKHDIICEAIYRMVDQINQAREDENARHPGANS